MDRQPRVFDKIEIICYLMIVVAMLVLGVTQQRPDYSVLGIILWVVVTIKYQL